MNRFEVKQMKAYLEIVELRNDVVTTSVVASQCPSELPPIEE